MKGPKAKDGHRETNKSTPYDIPPPFNPNNITHSGWLTSKQKNHKSRFKKNWQQGWFVIADGQLHYFKHQGSVSLHGCGMTSRNSKDADHEPPGYVLEVHKNKHTSKESNKQKESSQKPFLLSSRTQSDIDIWEREIRRVRGGVFGTSLEETIVNESENETKEIPAVVELCVSYIREHGLMEEGIFRLNGRTGIVKKLQEDIDLGNKPDFSAVDISIHTVASLLKRYLQLLPEPVIPWRHCKCFIPVMQTLRENDDIGRRQMIIQLALLPRVNYNILKYLCEFLHEVHMYENQNKMGLGNLANIFAPHILRPQNAQGAYLLGSTALSLQLVHYLIRNHDKVFPPMDSINTSPPPKLRSGYRNDLSHRLYRKGTNEYKLDKKVERRTDESRARSKSRTNRRSGRVDWCASTEITDDGECIDTVKVQVHSVYENMDVANSLSLIESIKSQISDTSNVKVSAGGHKVKRYGVSYKDPGSILSSTAVGQRCVSAPNDEALLLMKKNKIAQNGGDVHSQVQIQSTYQNIELGPTILATIASSMKDHAMSVSHSETSYHQKGALPCIPISVNTNKEPSPDTSIAHCPSPNFGEDNQSNYINHKLAEQWKSSPSPTCTYNFPTRPENNLYQNPLPFPMTLPDELLKELKHHNSTTNHSMIPKPSTNKEYASSNIIHASSKTLPRSTSPPSAFNFNGQMMVNSKVLHNGDGTTGHMQALKAKLRQKEHEVSKQYHHNEVIQKDYEILKVRLGAEESARVMIEEHNRQLTSEVHLLQKRLGLVR